MELSLYTEVRTDIMGTTKKNAPVTSRALQHYTWLVIFYTVLIFLAPVNASVQHTYHLSALEYHVVMFAIALPSMAVWLAAFIGYAHLRLYARSISKTPEGIYFDQLA